MNRISRNISIALRAERLIAQRKMETLRTKTGLMAAAGLVSGIGLIMLNVAGFFALEARMSPQMAALFVALANFVLAILLGIYAGRVSSEPDLRGATEVRDMALEDIEAEVEETVHQVKEVVSDVRQVVRNPLGSSLPGIIVPLASSLIKSARK
ncbi:MAG: phage holin family protein [Rhizobiaceae bacterium]